MIYVDHEGYYYWLDTKTGKSRRMPLAQATYWAAFWRAYKRWPEPIEQPPEVAQ